jgi:hypothetical protein
MPFGPSQKRFDDKTQPLEGGIVERYGLAPAIHMPVKVANVCGILAPVSLDKL